MFLLIPQLQQTWLSQTLVRISYQADLMYKEVSFFKKTIYQTRKRDIEDLEICTVDIKHTIFDVKVTKCFLKKLKSSKK